MVDNAVISKIRKLLALAEGDGNLHEKQSARRHAEALASKYLIDMTQLKPVAESAPKRVNFSGFDFSHIKKAYPGKDDSDYRSKGPGTYGKEDDG